MQSIEESTVNTTQEVEFIFAVFDLSELENADCKKLEN